MGNAVAAQQVAAAFVFGLYFYALCTVFVVSISSLSTRAEFRDESLLVLLDAAQAFVFRVESLKFLASFREQLSFVLRAAPWYEFELSCVRLICELRSSMIQIRRQPVSRTREVRLCVGLDSRSHGS